MTERLTLQLCPWSQKRGPLHYASPKLFADETPAPVLDHGRGRTKTGQLWPMSATTPAPPAVDYAYARDRRAERSSAHLERVASCRSTVIQLSRAGRQGPGEIRLLLGELLP